MTLPDDPAGPARAVNAMFDRIAVRYDLMNTVMTGGLHHVWRARAARRALARSPRRVLDVATGTGDFALALARRQEPARVVGVDFVPAMTRLAAAKATRRRRLRGRVDFVVGDALRLPFPDGCFDAVTVGWGVRNLADLDAGLRELARVLEPGGTIVILEMTPSAGAGLAERVARWYATQVVPRLGAVVAADRDAYQYLPQSVQTFPAAAVLARRLEAAGFVRVAYTFLGFGTVALHSAERPSAR